MHNTSTSSPPQPPPTTSQCASCTPGHRPPPSLTPAWPPEGLRRRRESPSLHAVVLWSFRIPIQSRLFPHLGWKRGFRSHRGRRTCASTQRCRSCDTGVVAPRSSSTLRLATSSSSSTLVREHNPRVLSNEVHVQNSFRYSITN
jgi:hypothetical protein